MRTWSPSRRGLLQLLAAAGAAATWPLRARAEAAPPQRVLFVVTRHGTVHDAWRTPLADAPPTQPQDVDLSTATAEDLGPVLAPLQRHLSRILVLDGLSHATAMRQRELIGHLTGHTAVLTGTGTTTAADGLYLSGGRSLDLHLADRLGATRVPSIQAALRAPEYPVSFEADGRAVPVAEAPLLGAQRLFPDAFGPAITLPTDARARAAGRAAARMDAWLAGAPPELGVQLQAHADLLRDLQVRLGTPALACAPPTLPDDSVFDYVARRDAWFDTIVAAFACDVTRVATLATTQIPSTVLGYPAGIDVHEVWAHQADRNANARAAMVAYHTQHATEVAALLDRLDAVPTSDGTLLDHTLVVWLHELGTGPHDLTPVPALLAGGRALRGGRFQWLAATDKSPDPSSPDVPIGPPINRLLASVADLLGTDAPATLTASIPALDGSPIDAATPLPGLR